MSVRRLLLVAVLLASGVPAAVSASVGAAEAPGLPPAGLPSLPGQVPGIALPIPNAELVTVEQHSIDATWTTADAADTTICIGPSAAAMRCETQERGVRHHYAHVAGLRPGTRYAYELRSGGVPQPPSPTNPGAFATLEPPPGRHLFDFVEINDTHFGEQCSGTAVTAPLVSQPLPPCFSEPDYATRMTQAHVADIRRRNVGLTLINGDLTSDASLEQMLRAKGILGRLPGRWHAVRGNHDRSGQHPEETACGADDDCFRAVFHPSRPPGRIHYSFDHRGHHFIVLDSEDPGDDQGDLTDAAQNAFLRRDLARHRQQRTFIFFHHPVSEYATAYAAPPVVFGVRPDRGGTEFLDLMASFPNVVGVFNAHTHRNFVSYSPRTGARLPYIESGAAKEYPGGYSIVRVYSGGYSRNFYR
ncbi:MAG: metallophosphoesterase family protein, partial [Solirubrobacterales bacterium]